MNPRPCAISSSPTNAKRDSPIGVFDSGMGGLTVLAALRQTLPDEDFIYLGDTARLPYGTKSSATVQRYAVQATSALVSRGVKAVVVACNTASGLAMDLLAERFAPLPVFGVVLPGASAAAQIADKSGVLVLATESTVAGGAYQHAILTANRSLPVYAHACPLWVTLAEQGTADASLIEHILRHDIPQSHPATVLLGCTHFPVFLAHLKSQYTDTEFVDSAVTTADWVHEGLSNADLLNPQGGSESKFLVTDDPARFRRIGGHFLGVPIEAAELIDL